MQIIQDIPQPNNAGCHSNNPSQITAHNQDLLTAYFLRIYYYFHDTEIQNSNTRHHVIPLLMCQSSADIHHRSSISLAKSTTLQLSPH